MKGFLFGFMIFSLLFSGCRSGKPALQKLNDEKPTANNTATTNFSEPATWLLGYLKLFQFKDMPHAEWFNKGYDSYNPDPAALMKLKEIDMDNLSITIVMGTWCPDSRREVPRFMKIIDLWGFPEDKITFIGVDISKNAPVGGFAELGIERVPTFIIMKNKIETGRIIENPVASLEQDMLNILTRNENNEN